MCLSLLSSAPGRLLDFTIRVRGRFFKSIQWITSIHMVNLAALDLNLLVALESLLDEASVGRAADRVSLSQPAMSHALKRLRALLGDPLLVRVGARMHLTARGE